MLHPNNVVMRFMRRHMSFVCLALIAVSACKDSKGAAPSSGSDGSGSGSATPSVPMVKKEKKLPNEPIETTRDKMLQDAEEKDRTGAKDGSKGDKNDSEWIPAEFKSGMSRWKDVGVYLDGKPIAFMTFGELPIALKPLWVKDQKSAEKPPGSGSDFPGWVWSQQRFYRFDEYLKALGVPLAKVKQIHVYGAKFSETEIATGKDLLSKAAAEFRFRFGGNTFGKAIPRILNDFGNGKSPDKISSVMIYIDKKPPTLVRNEGLYLDGVLQEGVPYYGEPVRGGVRVYVDDRLAAIIKRQDLDVSKATKYPDGDLHWKLADVLASQGVKLDKQLELWTIRDELRQDAPLAPEQFNAVTFSASSQAKGGIQLDIDGKKVRANALAFHSRHLSKDEIPVVTKDDEE